MQTANIRLYLDGFKNDIPLNGVTPTEIVLLRKKRQKKVGTDPIHDVVLGRDVARKSNEEVRRLSVKYGRKAVREAFPGDMPTLPETFEEVGVKIPGAVVKPVDPPEVVTPTEPVELKRPTPLKKT